MKLLQSRNHAFREHQPRQNVQSVIRRSDNKTCRIPCVRRHIRTRHSVLACSLEPFENTYLPISSALISRSNQEAGCQSRTQNTQDLSTVRHLLCSYQFPKPAFSGTVCSISKIKKDKNQKRTTGGESRCTQNADGRGLCGCMYPLPPPGLPAYKPPFTSRLIPKQDFECFSRASLLA